MHYATSPQLDVLPHYIPCHDVQLYHYSHQGEGPFWRIDVHVMYTDCCIVRGLNASQITKPEPPSIWREQSYREKYLSGTHVMDHGVHQTHA